VTPGRTDGRTDRQTVQKHNVPLVIDRTGHTNLCGSWLTWKTRCYAAWNLKLNGSLILPYGTLVSSLQGLSWIIKTTNYCGTSRLRRTLWLNTQFANFVAHIIVSNQDDILLIWWNNRLMSHSYNCGMTLFQVILNFVVGYFCAKYRTGICSGGSPQRWGIHNVCSLLFLVYVCLPSI
jgi:hypothetical protein